MHYNQHLFFFHFVNLWWPLKFKCFLDLLLDLTKNRFETQDVNFPRAKENISY